MGYLTVNPFVGDGFLDIDYLNSQEAVFENQFLRHGKCENPLQVIIDGKTNKAAVSNLHCWFCDPN